MRILVAGVNYAPDLIGVARYNTELCEALASFGHKVRVVTAPPYYPEWRVPKGYQSWHYRFEYSNRVIRHSDGAEPTRHRALRAVHLNPLLVSDADDPREGAFPLWS